MSAPHQAQIQGGFCHGGYDLQAEIRLINGIASREIIQKSISKNLTKSNPLILNGFMKIFFRFLAKQS